MGAVSSVGAPAASPAVHARRHDALGRNIVSSHHRRLRPVAARKHVGNADPLERRRLEPGFRDDPASAPPRPPTIVCLQCHDRVDRCRVRQERSMSSGLTVGMWHRRRDARAFRPVAPSSAPRWRRSRRAARRRRDYGNRRPISNGTASVETTTPPCRAEWHRPLCSTVNGISAHFVAARRDDCHVRIARMMAISSIARCVGPVRTRPRAGR